MYWCSMIIKVISMHYRSQFLYILPSVLVCWEHMPAAVSKTWSLIEFWLFVMTLIADMPKVQVYLTVIIAKHFPLHAYFSNRNLLPYFCLCGALVLINKEDDIHNWNVTMQNIHLISYEVQFVKDKKSLENRLQSTIMINPSYLPAPFTHDRLR